MKEVREVFQENELTFSGTLTGRLGLRVFLSSIGMPEYTIAGRRTRQKSLEFVKQGFRGEITCEKK